MTEERKKEIIALIEAETHPACGGCDRCGGLYRAIEIIEETSL